MSFSIDPSIFRAYDIRGHEQQLTPNVVEAIARGLARNMEGTKAIVLGFDGRLSSPALRDAMVAGFNASGVDVIDIGLCATPVLYFARCTLELPHAVMITGSHNPREDNGIKIILNGNTFFGDDLQALRLEMENATVVDAPHQGQYQLQNEMIAAYQKAVREEIHLSRPLKVVVDCGNGAAGGALLPSLYEQLGCEVIPLHTEIDGRFPHHHPDPSRPENLLELQETVLGHGADLGLALDGDGDRIALVDDQGSIIWPDELMVLLIPEILRERPKQSVIFDVKCARMVKHSIESAGGQPVLSPTGHAFVKNIMKETQACFGGEMSGHLFFSDRWFGFDDGVYAGARILEWCSNRASPLHKATQQLPQSYRTAEVKIPVSDAEKFDIVRSMIQKAQALEASFYINTIDGLRLESERGFGLLRASNTSPYLVARIEADTAADAADIAQYFSQWLKELELLEHWEMDSV